MGVLFPIETNRSTHLQMRRQPGNEHVPIRFEAPLRDEVQVAGSFLEASQPPQLAGTRLLHLGHHPEVLVGHALPRATAASARISPLCSVCARPTSSTVGRRRQAKAKSSVPASLAKLVLSWVVT